MRRRVIYDLQIDGFWELIKKILLSAKQIINKNSVSPPNPSLSREIKVRVVDSRST